jgi:glycine/D-amino acid oxidase-like deaminating enzyme
VRVAVVGAGAVGATVAHDLAGAETDVDVTLFDSGESASGSTGRAAGICYDAYAGDRDARIAGRAMDRFHELADEHDEFTLTDCPYVMLASRGDRRRIEAIRESVEHMQRHGLAVDLVEPDALAERFPSLRTDDVAIAAVAENACYTNPGRYVTAIVERARDRGVAVHTGTPVGIDTQPVGVTPDHGEVDPYDAVVVTAGAHSKRLLSKAGFSIALKPYRVQALTATCDHDRPIVYDATAGWYCRPHPTGLLAGDGTITTESDPDEWRRTADPAFVRSARGRLVDRLRIDPGSVPVDDAWAGLCTATPDRDPLLGELRPGLYVASGWQGHGFMRAPAVGELLADQVLGNGDGIDAYDPTRFVGDESFEIAEGMIVDEGDH